MDTHGIADRDVAARNKACSAREDISYHFQVLSGLICWIADHIHNITQLVNNHVNVVSSNWLLQTMIKEGLNAALSGLQIRHTVALQDKAIPIVYRSPTKQLLPLPHRASEYGK